MLVCSINVRMCTKFQAESLNLSYDRGCLVNWTRRLSKVATSNELLSLPLLRYGVLFGFFWGVNLISVRDTLLILLENSTT